MNLKSLSIALVVMLGCGLAQAQRVRGDGPKPAGRPASQPANKLPRGYWSILAGELKQAGQPLTDDQIPKIKEKIGAEKAALEPLNQKLADNKKAAKEARDAGNKEGVRKLGEDAKVIQDDIQKATEKAQREVRALLTPAQNEAWAACDLVRPAKRRMSKLTLTADQEAKLMDLAKGPARKVLEAKDDAKALADIRDAYWKAVKEQVLTPDQVKALETASKPASRPPEKR